MRRFVCVGLVVCLSTPTIAQSSSAPQTSLPSADELAKRDILTIGVGGAFVPDYEGSDDYRIIPAGGIRARVNGISISSNGPYLTADLIPQSGKFGFDAGHIVGLRVEIRRHSDDDVVKLMVKRKTAVEAGAFVGVSFRDLIDPYDTLSVSLNVTHDITDAHKSTVFDPQVAFSTPVSRKTYASLGAGIEMVSGKFARYYFGVTPADVAATGGVLPLYTPNGGLKNVWASLLVNQSITGDLLGGFSIFGLVQYSRLVGDFSRSPIVAERGSANQWLGSLGVAYTWSDRRTLQ
jgi:outer membrane scaffolding protein for murein synthesis (MipA/OmpV family)